ncbi:pyridoxamine 5'-phosphate oxidase family protein [Leifsonia sp. RAF41]|uniref:pyridoxamine 5'-phosphate oxidase family protein n=1 Tax=Leifsonia sp. RAF41 TaxID=3233056 RepID=UPI003F9BF3E7
MNAVNRDEGIWSPQGPATVLSEDSCWAILETHSFGRVGLSNENQPEIFPVDYAVTGREVVFRTADGTKLRHLTANPAVAFEVDERDGEEAWSISLRGEAHVLHDPSRVRRVEQLSWPDWVPTKTYVYVAIHPHVVSGRRISRHLHATRRDETSE